MQVKIKEDAEKIEKLNTDIASKDAKIVEEVKRSLEAEELLKTKIKELEAQLKAT